MNNELMTTDGAALTPAQVTILTQKTPSEVIKARPGPGGRSLSYVEHSWVTQTLNEAFGWAWSWDVIEWRMLPADKPREVFVLGKLTVHTSKGDLVKTQFGSANVKHKNGAPLSIGDDLKAASSDALKKASSLLGLALDLYSSDAPRPTRQRSQRRNGNGKASNPRPPAPKANGNGAFSSKGDALTWAMTTGAFQHSRHADNAYEKLKRERQPKTAAEMAQLWRDDVAQRVAARERDEALPVEPASRGKDKLFKS